MSNQRNIDDFDDYIIPPNFFNIIKHLFTNRIRILWKHNKVKTFSKEASSLH